MRFFKILLIILIIFIYSVYMDNLKFEKFIETDNEIQLTCFHEIGHFIMNDSGENISISILPNTESFGRTTIKYYDIDNGFRNKILLAGKCSEFIFSDIDNFNNSGNLDLEELYKIYNFKTKKQSSDEYKTSYNDDSLRIKRDLIDIYFLLKSRENEILAYSIILNDEKVVNNFSYFWFLKERLKLSDKIIKNLWKKNL